MRIKCSREGASEKEEEEEDDEEETTKDKDDARVMVVDMVIGKRE